MRRALTAFGLELGENPMLVQGAGGNISEKDGAHLTVKASGVWLRDCEKPNAFVTLSLDRAQALATDGVEDLRAALAEPSPARPSIEAAFHALLPDRVIAHVHSIHALVHAVQPDGEARVSSLLQGLPWCWIPYARPGLPLARALVSAASPGNRIFVLQNHGLIVTGDSIVETRALLLEVEKRLAVPPRAGATTPPRGVPSAPPGWRLPQHPAIHVLATDPLAREILQRGALYPDQVVFLGARAVEGVPEVGFSPLPPYAIVPGLAVFVEGTKGPIVDEMLLGHALLLERLTSPDLRTLTDVDTRALLGWEAETYRQGLSKNQVAV